MEKDLPFLVTFYLSCGLLWTLWQAQSKFTRGLAAKFDREGRAWIFFVAFLCGIVIWPLGIAAYLVFFVVKLWRRYGP